jgi:hypothetical protein
MTAEISDTSPANVSPAMSTTARPAPTPAPPSWAWMRGALILAGAAQLITISALVSADPLAATWWSLLLGVAPALVVAAAAFTPAPANLAIAAVAAVVLVVGMIGGITHIALWFLPALVVLIVGVVKLWPERA